MMSSTPVSAANTPKKELRLRGIPAHLADALSRLENSVGSPEDSDVKPNDRAANVTFTTRIYSLTTRLLEFVNNAQTTQEENTTLRKYLQEIKQKSAEKEDGYLREITRLKIVVDETYTETQNLRNDLGLATASAEALRERAVDLEKDKLSLQRHAQNLEDRCQSMSINIQKLTAEKKEVKESRDSMEVELASERNRNNHLAGELQACLQLIERSKAHFNDGTGLTLAQECLSCAKRRSLEEKLKQKIQCLEAELELSKNDAAESERKLQALAEELRVRVVEEKVRSQKLARKNSQLAAERNNAAQQLHAFEEVLNKAHSMTFNAEPQDDTLHNDTAMNSDETTSREVMLLRRLGVFRDTDASSQSVSSQTGDTLSGCATM